VRASRGTMERVPDGIPREALGVRFHGSKKLDSKFVVTCTGRAQSGEP
jgi:hypothetical protein